MTEYIIKILYGAKTKTGKDLTIDRIIGQVEGLGGKAVDDKEAMMAVVDYSGSVKDLYRKLDYDLKEILITPLRMYKVPDGREKLA